MERNVNLNVVTLGDIAVGKTSIIKRIKDGHLMKITKRQ